MARKKIISIDKMKFILSILFLGFWFGTDAQKRDSQEIKFTEAWVWEYQNDNIPAGEFGHKGEMVIYREPNQNFWLFTAEAFGISGEMLEWIIGKPDGTFVLCAADEFGKNTINKEKLNFGKDSLMPQYYDSTNRPKVFNQNKLGFPEISGLEYSFKFEKTKGSSSFYIGDYPANFQPIYFFNRLAIEARLPIQFPVDFPKNKLLLEEESWVNGKRTSVRFKEISHTEYFVELSEL